MIPRVELQRLAAQAGVRVELQERDYVLGCFLLGLARLPEVAESLAFKGGTALRKIYFPTFRFSETWTSLCFSHSPKLRYKRKCARFVVVSQPISASLCKSLCGSKAAICPEKKPIARGSVT